MAQFLVPRVRKVPQESKGLTGGIDSTYIKYLTKAKAFSKIISRALTGERKNRHVLED